MLQYPELIKKNLIKNDDCFCVMCGKNLYVVYTPQEKRFYHLCKKCNVVKYYKQLEEETEADTY